MQCASRTDVNQHAVFWVQLGAESVEEPELRMLLAAVVLLQPEHDLERVTKFLVLLVDPTGVVV
jgi:hypothetical protein